MVTFENPVPIRLKLKYRTQKTKGYPARQDGNASTKWMGRKAKQDAAHKGQRRPRPKKNKK